ncbi:unnamed protein product [Closterium sp. NIES-53]
MKIVLADLIVASHTGMAATDPNGVDRFVVPLLFSYVADYPETCKVSCTQQLGSVRPCSLCYVHREHLRDMDREATEMRAVEKQEGLLEDPAEAARYATMSVPVRSWCRSCRTLWGNTYLTMGPDVLHAIFIGFWLYIRDSLRGNDTMACAKDRYTYCEHPYALGCHAACFQFPQPLLPHYVRAAASLHGHTAFSCVEYEMAAGQLAHGRLLMLLEAEQDVPGMVQEVEVVVIHRLVDRGLDEHTGCRTLSAPQAMGGLAVIEVAAIRRAVHCVPSFKWRGIWYLNRWAYRCTESLT